ncbi:Holliday junction resolvase RuvX [Anaerococcus hydrogenalis]|uniref:Putative pre-16S rRNA nuclease n=2 Tax=Anaerococcus hydrogenalis TaxID=33029 RepID=A0A2N6UL50_9FIRM|nr:Holliday junction resolvase RuvX [Anaerococcus hydrogenalis]MBS5988404.1 Holliday junction resolvase RuvX [Anaerococcus hydrogenalis]MDK7694538.1 Holliday junction resolvase RuvX [Anaerococcus hydrogenalis]MDK7696316.1 Holliday junction resolvase RuvX [Anaerococcus hydrogenalis]MDK7707565.1 Holliday junction resolvase RuvX [Anaerococcus hydrogenalis]PMC82578.1 Holliday junction resolvase RuvX [Anaerococcus hydrogenalis]
MSRIMGLDLGDKTIGVALSDPFFITAQAYLTIKRKKTSLDIKKLVDIIKEKEVNLIIIGLPKNMNNTLGPQAMKVISFVDLLKKETDIDIKYQDERMTTIQSDKVLMDMSVKRENRKKYIDKIAASFILQTYLDGRSNG